jgi:hypothetical protein
MSGACEIDAAIQSIKSTLTAENWIHYILLMKTIVIFLHPLIRVSHLTESQTNEKAINK